MFSLIQQGGPLMLPMLAGSILALAVFIERLLQYQRQTLHVGEFLKGVCNLARRRRFPEALQRCEEGHGPVVQVVHAAIRHHRLSRPELKELVQEVAQLQVPRLERHLVVLASIAQVRPLLGLLGTVTGMIRTFMQMQAKAGTATVTDLAGGIWEALITTAGGLAVGIPALLAYNYLVSRLNGFLRDMERAGIEIVQALGENAQIIDFEEASGTAAQEKPGPAKSGGLS
jgi:biopolymer transport protein ExbB